MAFPVSCPACGASYRIPDALFATRFAGRATTIKCKRCTASIPVDGTHWKPGAAESLPPEVQDFIPESIRPAEVAPVSAKPASVTLSGVPASLAPSGSSSSVPSTVSSSSLPPSSVPSSSKPPGARPRSLTPRPWVGLKSISIVPAPGSSRPPSGAAAESGSAAAAPASQPAEAASAEAARPEEVKATPPFTTDLMGPRATIEPGSETPTRNDLPARSRLPEVAPTQDTPTVAAPISSLLTPQMLADMAPPPSSRPPVSKPPPLPDSAKSPLAAAPTAAPKASPRDPTPARTAAAKAPRTAQPLPAGARYARFFALAVGAAIATVWIGSRIRRAEHAAGDAAAVPSAQAAAVGAALDQALEQAKTCDPGNSPPARSELTVTFAPSGKVATAELAGDSVNDALRACVLSHVQSLAISPFEGTPIEVRREVALGP